MRASTKPLEAKNILPASVSARRNKADPEKYEVYSFDSFKIIGLLGSGSFAQVYHVRRKGTREEYALKQISKKLIQDNEMADQLCKEVFNMHGLTKKGCTNIVQLVDHFEDVDHAFLLMEYVKGVVRLVT